MSSHLLASSKLAAPLRRGLRASPSIIRPATAYNASPITRHPLRLCVKIPLA